MSGPYVIYFITRFLSVKFYETCSVHPLSKVMIIVQTLPQSTSLTISWPTINLSKNLKNIFFEIFEIFYSTMSRAKIPYVTNAHIFILWNSSSTSKYEKDLSRFRIFDQPSCAIFFKIIDLFKVEFRELWKNFITKLKNQEKLKIRAL